MAAEGGEAVSPGETWLRGASLDGLERIPQLSPVAAACQADRGAIALALAEPGPLIRCDMVIFI